MTLKNPDRVRSFDTVSYILSATLGGVFPTAFHFGKTIGIWTKVGELMSR
jgi:hypothetical protein